MADGKNSDELIRVFVYGTLKPGGHYWNRFCEGKVTKAVEGIVRGKLYGLSIGYPAITQSPEDSDNWVIGYVLTLTNQQALDGLDYLEGYSKERPASENEYQRVITEAFNISGESIGKVWTYVMEQETITNYGGSYIANGNWTHLT